MYEFTSQEEEWINSTENSALAKLCVQFAAGLNRLDFSLIDSLFALDCTYGSQSVFDVLKGYEQVAEYWSGKMDTLTRAGDSARISAELATEPQNGLPCIVIYQRRSEVGDQGPGEKLAYLTLKTQGGEKIRELFMVSVAPTPDSCKTIDIFPGRSIDEIREIKELEGGRIFLSEQVVFVLFVMDGIPLCQAMERAVEEIMPDYGPAVFQRITDEDSATCGKHGVIAFPTLDIVYQGKVIRRIQGTYSPVLIRDQLEDLFDRK
jgi:hypothetical protein